MSTDRTTHERPVEHRGHLYIRLKSGRMLTFWDVIGLVETAHTDLGRALSRAFKLARDDYDLESLEWRVDRLEEHLAALREYLDLQRGNASKRDRIALLRNVAGRTPEEAAAFLRKADELERGLDS